MAENLTAEDKAKMIAALEQLQLSVVAISELWGDEEEGTGESKYDDALNPEYPFSESFFEVYHNVHRWVGSAVERMK